MPWNNKYRRLDEGEIRFHPMTPDQKDAVIDELVKALEWLEDVISSNEYRPDERLFLLRNFVDGNVRRALATASNLKDEP